MAVVIYSEELGVYLGSCMGLGFWSKLDPVDQPSAVTFADRQEATAHMASWDGGQRADVRLVDVVPDDGDYASIAAVVQAGLPGWLDTNIPVANTLPL